MFNCSFSFLDFFFDFLDFFDFLCFDLDLCFFFFFLLSLDLDLDSELLDVLLFLLFLDFFLSFFLDLLDLAGELSSSEEDKLNDELSSSLPILFQNYTNISSNQL